MLRQAQRKVARRQWANVQLYWADASSLTWADLGRIGDQPEFSIDRVVCTLGFSVIPNWVLAFERSWALLRQGVRYAIMDWHIAGKSRFAALLAQIAAAEMDRRWWEPLDARATNLEQASLFRNRIRVISGSKGAPDLT